MATKAEVIVLALRRIGVVGEGEPANGDQMAAGEAVLDSLFAEIETEFAISWELTAVPAAAFVPLANLLSVEMAPHYARPAPQTRASAWRRFMATVRSDNRPDFRDLDDSGTISDEEEAAGLRAQYY